MSAPWMPLYVADYLADTAHLCASEHGAYLLLIMHYWRAGKLPTDEKQLQRIARMTAREWANSRDTLAALFGEGWTHKRIKNELAKSELKSTARAESGSRGGKAKALKNNDASIANATVLPQQKDGFALASSSHSQPEEKKEDTSLRSVSGASAPQAQILEKPLSKPKTNRGTRLSADWTPSERNRSDASAIGVPSGQLDRLATRFRDYWSAKAGKDGVKLDWDATWRNWCDREAESKGWGAQTSGGSVAVSMHQTSVWVLEDSPAGKAWAEYRKQIKVIPPPWRDDPKDPRRRGWHFPTEFPPIKQGQAA